MKRKAKREIGYVAAHNRAVNLYKKTSTFLLWAGVLNVFSVIIGIIQMMANSNLVVNEQAYNWPRSGFALSFSLQIFLNSLLINNLDKVLADVLIILIALSLGALFAFFGVFASKGKLLFLVGGSVIYLLDFVAMFFVYNMFMIEQLRTWTNYAFTLASHVVILIAMTIAIAMYLTVIEIEKKYKGESSLNVNEENEVEEIAHGE